MQKCLRVSAYRRPIQKYLSFHSIQVPIALESQKIKRIRGAEVCPSLCFDLSKASVWPTCDFSGPEGSQVHPQSSIFSRSSYRAAWIACPRSVGLGLEGGSRSGQKRTPLAINRSRSGHKKTPLATGNFSIFPPHRLFSPTTTFRGQRPFAKNAFLMVDLPLDSFIFCHPNFLYFPLPIIFPPLNFSGRTGGGEN